MSELKPCPFCGSPGWIGTHAEVPDMWIAGCSDADCIAANAAYDFVSDETARNAWNTRASDPASEAERDGALEYGRVMTEKFERLVHVTGPAIIAQKDAAEAERDGLRAALEELADELDRAALDRQEWADHPGIGGNKPRLASHLRGKRYGYSHAAQLLRSRLAALNAKVQT